MFLIDILTILDYATVHTQSCRKEINRTKTWFGLLLYVLWYYRKSEVPIDLGFIMKDRLFTCRRPGTVDPAKLRLYYNQ